MLKLVEYSLKDSLPSAIQALTKNLAWMMNWTETPIKTRSLEPEIEKTAKRAKYSYGPYQIRGSKVRSH